ncbi:MAG TPA: accessory factor UbiK family protein [Steroidobacteraceae bacterium]|nr:accessory factor UbiK family protein [Steroidobacteraceae bacterium]
MEPLSVNEIARRLLESLPAGLRAAQADLENNFRAVLRSTLGKLDLVTREEFDVQTKVLERTRARLALLETRLAELEQAAGRSAGSA